MLRNEVERCISCGFCEAVCPTLPSAEFNLWKGARGRVIMGRQLLEAREEGNREVNLSDSFYSCLDCHACLYVCPAGVNAGKVSQLSRELIVSDHVAGKENPVARMIASVTVKKMNPLGTRKKSAGWSRGLEFDNDSDTLLYTGNMYQLMPYTGILNSSRKKLGHFIPEMLARIVARVPSLSFAFSLRRDIHTEEVFNGSLRNIALLLKKAGLKFDYLGREEPYPGTFLHDLGYTELFGEYAKTVTDIFRKRRIRRIITVDPHTYELLKYTYPEYVDDFDFEVSYYLDMLDGLKLRKTDDEVVYHEPCHFVLRDFKYEKPGEILKEISNVRMAKRSGKRNECCGGPNELLFPELAEGTSCRRHEDLIGTGAETIVTSCPICYANLDKGTRITDIADYLAERSE